jgi:inosine triphosphate pyrophosphatase
MPGPYIKWFLEKLGPSGLYRLLHGWDDKSAVAVCTLAYCEDPEKQNILLFKGEVDGHIVEPRGTTNFGWDPCFQPLGSSKTYAEMSETEKHQISHRFKAFKLFKEHFIK